jgi:fructosamine-3-kinase
MHRFLLAVVHPLEELVSTHIGHPWKAKSITDLHDFASHPAAVFSDGRFAAFAKLSEAPNAREQFELEVAGLRLLGEHSGVLTPTAIGVVTVPAGTLLVLEAVQAMPRGQREWRQIGQTLARIHQVKAKCFGLETHGYFGPLYQDNRPLPNWPDFYAERRLRPFLKLAVDAGNIPRALAQRVEALINRLPELCGPVVVPTLVHGDAQQNNFISTEQGAVVIDPSVHYGHREVDLALVDYFEPVPDVVFDAYREILPIDPGFAERRDLWRVSGYLATVAVDGAPYLAKLTDVVTKYI